MRKGILATALAFAAMLSAGASTASASSAPATPGSAGTALAGTHAPTSISALANQRIAAAKGDVYQSMYGTVIVPVARVRLYHNTLDTTPVVGRGYSGNLVWVHCELYTGGHYWGWVKAPSNGRWGWMRGDLYRAGYQGTGPGGGSGNVFVKKC